MDHLLRLEVEPVSNGKNPASPKIFNSNQD
jgi:hypothetical protein